MVDFLGPPAGDVQPQAVRRAVGRFGVGPVRERAGIGIVVACAVDPAAQRLFVFTVHPFRLTATADSRGTVAFPGRKWENQSPAFRSGTARPCCSWSWCSNLPGQACSRSMSVCRSQCPHKVGRGSWVVPRPVPARVLLFVGELGAAARAEVNSAPQRVQTGRRSYR